MSSVATVWLIVGLLSTAMALAILIALIRHILVLLRTIGRFGDEIGPIVRDISAQAQRASSRSQSLSAGRPFGGP